MVNQELGASDDEILCAAVVQSRPEHSSTPDLLEPPTLPASAPPDQVTPTAQVPPTTAAAAPPPVEENGGGTDAPDGFLNLLNKPPRPPSRSEGQEDGRATPDEM